MRAGREGDVAGARDDGRPGPLRSSGRRTIESTTRSRTAQAIRTALWTGSSTRTSAGSCAAPPPSASATASGCSRTRSSSFIDRTTAVWVLLGLAIPFAIAGWEGLLWGGFVRMAFFSQVAYSVNSIGHTFGSRAVRDEGREPQQLVPRDARVRRRLAQQPPRVPVDGVSTACGWRQIDPSAFVIRALAALGLVWNVKTPPAALVERRRRRLAGRGGAMTETTAPPDRRPRRSSGRSRFLRELFSATSRGTSPSASGTARSSEPEAGEAARFTLVLRHPGAVRAMFWPPGRAGTERGVRLRRLRHRGRPRGGLPARRPAACARGPASRSGSRSMRRLLALPSGRRSRAGRERAQPERPALVARARPARPIAYHYDVSNEFFALWLDSTMVYSCAVFASPDRRPRAPRSDGSSTTSAASSACGRASACSTSAAAGAGSSCTPRGTTASEALGVTLSRARPSSPRCESVRRGSTTGAASSAATTARSTSRKASTSSSSVGMYEHVARDALPSYFGHAWRLLKPGGVFLAHGIAGSPTAATRAGPSFLETYVFPDHGARARLDHADRRRAGEARDTRRREPARALHADSPALARAARGEPRRGHRAHERGRLPHLAAHARRQCHRFAKGHANVYQALLAKPTEDGASQLPLSRADWYA